MSSRNLDAQERPAVAHCENPKCRGEIYREETTYFYEGRWLCSDCFKAEIEHILESDPRTLALAMGLDMQRYI